MYKCKKCESNEYVKAGFVKGEPRYKCKICGKYYTQESKKIGHSEKTKKQAIGGK